MSAPRILFYVQYLLGIGHVRRSALIVQALCRQGAQVDVIFGGASIPNMSFGTATIHQLTAIKSADSAFSGLVKIDGSAFTDADKRARTEHLLAICQQLQPDLIVTETYPFGRRQMRFELQPLLEWIKQQPTPPVLVASIRDILQRRSPVREQECIELVQDHYQQILVHGDPRFYPLQKSFPPAAAIQHKLHYTGYVCPTMPSKSSSTSLVSDADFSDPSLQTIVVSIGGGSVGKEILAAALALYKTGYASELNWLLITGPNMAAAEQTYFRAQQRGNLQVLALSDDFLNTLKNAHVSISMAGYNTVMDLLLTRVPAVVIPFAGEGETEQMARSQVLAEANILQLLSEQDLNTDSLQKAIENAVQQPPSLLEIDNQGAQQSAKLLIAWANQARESSTDV